MLLFALVNANFYYGSSGFLRFCADFLELLSAIVSNSSLSILLSSGVSLRRTCLVLCKLRLILRVVALAGTCRYLLFVHDCRFIFVCTADVAIAYQRQRFFSHFTQSWAYHCRSSELLSTFKCSIKSSCLTLHCFFTVKVSTPASRSASVSPATNGAMQICFD